MRSSDIIFFGAVFAFFGLIIGFVAWYMGKKKKIHAAQELWAQAVARLGGRELSHSGPGGTRTFEVGGAALSVVNFVFLEGNIAKLVTPMAAANSWQSQLTGPCRRPTPPFLLTPFGNATAGQPGATGDPEFDARWTITPLLHSTPNDVLALLTPDVRRALNALPANTYQIASGGQQISAFRPDMIASEAEVAALTAACAMLVGGQPAQPGMAQGQAQGQIPGQPGQVPFTHVMQNNSMGADVSSRNNDKWTWHYSKLLGIMYGPIPVGIIVAAVFGAIYFASR